MSVLAIRLLLAAVFATAAAAKLAGRGRTLEGLRAFGVPRRMARPLAAVLPVAELGVAASLLPAGSARFGALGAAAWNVDGGAGAFAGVTGRIVSNFLLADSGELTDHQLGVLFLSDEEASEDARPTTLQSINT